MEQRLKLLQRYGLWIIDTVCVLASFQISFAIRYGLKNYRVLQGPGRRLVLLLVLFTLAYNFFLDWNHNYLRRGALVEFKMVLRFNVVLLVFIVAYIFAARQSYYISRLLIGRFLIINVVLMYGLHLLIKQIFRHTLHSDKLVTKLFVVAQKEYMEQTIRRLRYFLGVHTEIIGGAYAEDRPAAGGVTVEGVPVFSGFESLTEALTTTPVDEVFIYTPDISQRKLRKLIRNFEEMGVVCHYSLEIPDTGAAAVEIGEYGDYSVITYQKTRKSPKKLMVKRMTDIVGGIVGLAVTGILTIFIAPAIKLDSKGPVFFSQIRVGKNGRRFRIYKFRSMSADAEKRKQELMQENAMQGLMFKMDNDPRITRVGAFLRKTSLDEFPQFLNVLKGDMSLVGTRPPTEEEFEAYNEYYRRRISMTPGLTGMWQVSGRSDITDFDEVVKLDLTYIDNWSLSLDAKIIFKTIGILFTGRGAR